MRYYSWMAEPSWKRWTKKSSELAQKAIREGNMQLAMKIAAIWQGRMMLDPRYGNIENLDLGRLERKIKTGA